MADRKDRTPSGEPDKASARRARQAEALRRNLARRKAQARDRADGAGGGRAAEKDSSGT